jgi:hypothetical protein
MALKHRIEYLRKEHKGLLELAARIEAALTLAGRQAVLDHEKSLAQLRESEDSLGGVVEHCHADERIVESTLHKYAGEKERAKSEEEHRDLLRNLATFRDELRFATVDRLRGTIIAGHEFARTLQAHVAGESKLLDQIVAKALPPHRRSPSKKVHGATRVSRRTPRGKAHVRREERNVCST